MLSYDFMYQTVEPSKVLPLAALFLRWPYITAQRICTEMQRQIPTNTIQHELTIYRLLDIVYQSAPVGEYDYKGILLNVKLIFPDKMQEFEKMYENFCNMFVLIEDVTRIERRNRNYCTFPIGHKLILKNDICSQKNLHVAIPKILHEISCTFKEKQSINCCKINEIEKENIWPWLGPIAPQLAEDSTRTITEDREEIEFFVKAANELGQNNPKCLARMIKHRYPHVPHTMLVEIIDQTYTGNVAAKRKQGRRWLGLS